MISYYLNIRFYGNSLTHLLNIAFYSSNGSINYNSSLAVDLSLEINNFNDIDANCLSCKYSQKIINNNAILSSGGQPTSIVITDTSGLFYITSAIF